MPETMADAIQRDDWDELDNETKINVMATYIIDLENKVDKLDRDIDVIDGGY